MAEQDKENNSVIEKKKFGMISVKFKSNDNEVLRALKTLGVCFPQKGKIVLKEKASFAWMSTDEIAIFTSYERAYNETKKMQKRLEKTNSLCLNISDSRCSFVIYSRDWRNILAKGTPVDLSPNVFKMGDFRRTRIASVSAAFWMTTLDSVQVICMRSVGAYARSWLDNASDGKKSVNFFLK